MVLVMVCWVLAMISGLLWSRGWTGLLTAATAFAFVWTPQAHSAVAEQAARAQWTIWLQLTMLGVTPWLLAAQRSRDQQRLAHLHAEEAEALARLSEAARSLLSLQTSAQQMESQIAEITELYRVTKETSRALHFPELFEAALAIAPRLLSAQGLRLIDCANEAPQVLRANRTADGRMAQAAEGAGAQLAAMESAVVAQVHARGSTASGGVRELSCPFPDGVNRIAWAPLWREQKPVGVLVADELPEEQLKVLTIVANQLSLLLSRIHLYRQVEALAVTDALTGLFVRGHFMERAREELARSKRHDLACTILMADLDQFKEKNDTFGHLVGDVVLRDVARLLQRNLRDIDLIARYGGEEFILLLIETSAEQAMPIAQRLKQLIEVHPIRAYDELLTQTISIGLAGFPQEAQTLEELIERADQALYAAKRAGRNRVVRWSASLTSQ